MKKLLSCISILLICFSVSNHLYAQQCLTDDYPPEPDNPGAGPYESKNGWQFPTTGTIRVLVIFYELNYTGSTQDPTPSGGFSQWPADSLPTWAGDIFDPNPPVGIANGLVTRYYQYASSGALTVIGDYLMEPTNGVFTINTTTGSLNVPGVISEINNKLGGPSGAGIVTGNGFTDISDFDNWTFTTTATGPGLTKISSGDQKYDHLMFICRNSTSHGPGVGFAIPGSPGTILTYQSNTYSGYGA